MNDQYTNEPMLDMFIFETTHLIEQLEISILSSEKSDCYTEEAINEIFRIMHTIKGSSAMMLFNNISSLTHSIEDLFYFLREEKPRQVDYSILSDLIFESIDFIKLEIEKIKNNDQADGNPAGIMDNLSGFLAELKKVNGLSEKVKNKTQPTEEKTQYYIRQAAAEKLSDKNTYKAVIHFTEGCDMENLRAYTIVHNVNSIAEVLNYIPEDIIENDESINEIRKNGFTINLAADISGEELRQFLLKDPFVNEVDLTEIRENDQQNIEPVLKQIVLESNPIKVPEKTNKPEKSIGGLDMQTSNQGYISVPVHKLDNLMDLVSEMVISEAMVTQNPDLRGLSLDNFNKAARQLKKITGELQDMVMSVRMVPLSATFHKMHRIVRDMNKKLGKEVQLVIVGEETEVDKNIIEHISDPIMHLVRNSIDHGIESTQEREANGKSKFGSVTLEAKNAGNDVVILIKDDGKGLNKQKILDKARQNGMLHKPDHEMSEKETFNLIFLPGFSTKDAVSEFSGRGVGMDVVVKNIEKVGGSVSVDSQEGVGTTITMKIPLTLAIVDGMNISVGKACYTIPTIAIKQSFRPKETDIITDPDGNEMIMVRGECYPIIRLHQLFKVQNARENFHEGILIMVENEGKAACLFADELLGEQQVVVKALPAYIKNLRKIRGLSGCTLLGDGSISLILDVITLINNKQ